MFCTKCKNEIADGFAFCPHCGKKLLRSEYHRTPRSNGSGTICKVTGSRLKPWIARLPAEYESGKDVRRTIGYFKTYSEADSALKTAMNSKSPQSHVVTLKDVDEQFCKSVYYKKLSDSGRQSHNTAWEKLKPYSATKMSDFKTSQIQEVIDAMAKIGAAKSSVNKVRNLASLLCKHAMKNDLIDKNYARLSELDGKDAKEATPFSDLNFTVLWRNVELDTVKVILIMCYTGLRPSELFSIDIESDIYLGQWNYFRAGIKSDAGRGKDGTGRAIPIHSDILLLVTQLIGERDSGPLVITPTGRRCDLPNWRKREFYPCLESLKIQDAPTKDNPARLTPKSCRHSYYTNMRRYGADLSILTEIMGHEDIETGADNYLHYTDDDIAKICSQASVISSNLRAKIG